MVILRDVRLTQGKTISMGDLRRISDSDDVDWVFRPRRVQPDAPIDLSVGLRVLVKFGNNGWHRGRVSEVVDEDQPEGAAYRVLFADGDSAIYEARETREAAREYLKSGHVHAEAAVQPGRGHLHARRLRQRVAARPQHRTMRQMANDDRAARRQRRMALAGTVKTTGHGPKNPTGEGMVSGGTRSSEWSCSVAW